MDNRGLTAFGITVKKKLLDRNMTALELAEMLEVKPEYLSYILHGKRAGKKYICKIKKFLDL